MRLKKALAAKVNGEEVDLNRELDRNGRGSFDRADHR